MALCYSDSSSNYGEDVDLYIYDLTKRCEEERASSLTLTSIQTVARTDEIPHVSIVVFGIEYTFTKDIGITSTFVPSRDNRVGFKRARRLGKTRKTRFELENFLEILSEYEYEASTYNIFRHNCITFSNRVSKFLLGKSIPDDYNNTVSNLAMSAGATVAVTAGLLGMGALLGWALTSSKRERNNQNGSDDDD